MIISSFIGSVILLHLLRGDVDLQGVDVHHVDVDEEECRALWKSNTYRPATNDVNEDEDEVDIDDI